MILDNFDLIGFLFNAFYKIKDFAVAAYSALQYEVNISWLTNLLGWFFKLFGADSSTIINILNVKSISLLSILSGATLMVLVLVLLKKIIPQW